MVNWGVVIIGFILAIVFSLIGGTVGLFGSAVGVLLAGVVVGYMVNKDLMNGVIHGALIGVVGAVILTMFAFIMSTASPFLAAYMGLTALGSILLAILMGAIGGAIGSILTEKRG